MELLVKTYSSLFLMNKHIVIIEFHLTGASMLAITIQLKVAKSTDYNTIARFGKLGNVKECPKNSTCTPCTKKNILSCIILDTPNPHLHCIKRNPKTIH